MTMHLNLKCTPLGSLNVRFWGNSRRFGNRVGFRVQIEITNYCNHFLPCEYALIFIMKFREVGGDCSTTFNLEMDGGAVISSTCGQTVNSGIIVHFPAKVTIIFVKIGIANVCTKDNSQ